jgi:phenylalanyl-tRNA synthetase beta chain
VYGFNNFDNTLPAFSGAVIEQPHARAEGSTRSRLLALGYDEAVSSTFISTADAERFSSRKAVSLENPLSEETPLLRNSLVPGMLNMVAWNFNRGTTDIRLFEMGNVFSSASERVDQHKRVCVAATGSAAAVGVEHKPRPIDFFDLKGDVENLLALFSYRDLSFDAPADHYFHPGRSARVVLDGHIVGQLGQLHPDIAAERKFKQEVWLAEFDLDRLFATPLHEPRYERLSRFPSVERDFSLLLDNSITYERLRRMIEALRIPELISIEPREVFRGPGVPEGQYSLLLRITFQSTERTLRDDEVAGWSEQIIAAVKALGGSLRS